MTDRRIEVVAEVHSRAHMGADGVEADEKAWKWHWLNCAYCYNLTNVVVQSLDADWVAHLDELVEAGARIRETEAESEIFHRAGSRFGGFNDADHARIWEAAKKETLRTLSAAHRRWREG